MRPEKSKLLKISLCVLSCVFFGCGEPKSNDTGTVLTSDTIKKQLRNNTQGKDAQQDSPFMKILSSAMTKVLGDKGNTLGKYINTNGSIKAEFAKVLEDPESPESKTFIETLEQVIDAINVEVEKLLKMYGLTESCGVTDKAIEDWKKKGLKNKEVAKIICAWQGIFSEYSKFMKNPLQFLMSGKGWMHRSTVKAIDLAWRNFVEFLNKGCDKCESSLNDFINKNSGSEKDKEVAEEAKNVMNAISGDLSRIKGFVGNKHAIRVNTLKKVYSLIGNQFLPKYGSEFFGLINVQQANVENPEQKITTDWGNAVFNHFYLGVKSDRSSFSNPACALNGNTISKLKNGNYENLYNGYSEKYEKLLTDFVEFAINKKIIDDKFFSTNNVDAICQYLECYGKENGKVNNGRKDISLSPWLMLCAKNNWDKISEIVEFNTDEEGWTVKFKNDIKDIKELVNADNNYERLEVYAGILAICNLNYGLRHYKDGKSVGKNKSGFNLSDALEKLANNSDLNKYALKGRLKQWDDFKTAAENGTLKDEE